MDGMRTNQKGVTLTSLTIYVIVAGIVVVLLAFLNANFFSQMSDLTTKTSVTNEYSKFCSFFLQDLKASESVLEYNQTEIEFSNGAKYEIRKLEKTSSDEKEDEYVIYRNQVKVCDSIIGKAEEIGETTIQTPYMDYNHEKNTVTVMLAFSNQKDYTFTNNQTYLVGKGY